MDRNDLYRGLSVCITYFFQMLSSVEHISMRVFNRDAGLFSDSASLRLYADKASAGFADLKLSQKHNGLVIILKLLAFMLFFRVQSYKKRKENLAVWFLFYAKNDGKKDIKKSDKKGGKKVWKKTWQKNTPKNLLPYTTHANHQKKLLKAYSWTCLVAVLKPV